MCLPLLVFVAFLILKFLKRYNICPEVVQFLNSEEQRRQSTGSSVTGTLGRPKCQHASADEDLFARAAVLNSPPQTLVLKTCETGFELQSGIENDDSTKHL